MVLVTRSPLRHSPFRTFTSRFYPSAHPLARPQYSHSQFSVLYDTNMGVVTKNDERYRHRLESYISMYTYVNGVRRRRHQYETVSYSFVFSQRFRNGSIKSVLHSIQKANCQNTVSIYFFIFLLYLPLAWMNPSIIIVCFNLHGTQLTIIGHNGFASGAKRVEKNQFLRTKEKHTTEHTKLELLTGPSTHFFSFARYHTQKHHSPSPYCFTSFFCFFVFYGHSHPKLFNYL